MRLKEYSKLIGITYQTAWKHFNKGLIPGAYKLPTGTVIVPDNILERLENQFSNEIKDDK